jgi:CRISPR-associated protein Cas1
MRKLLNTLYLNESDYYLGVLGDALRISQDGKNIATLPLLNFESIVTHGRTGVSPALLERCQEIGVDIYFMSPYGKYLGKSTGPTQGNVLLRREQYRIADDSNRSIEISKNIVRAKTYNQLGLIDRMLRDHKLRVDTTNLSSSRNQIKDLRKNILSSENSDSLRGVEGKISQAYFFAFKDMILQTDEFVFEGRNRRPPLDPVNALLSYFYTLTSHMYTSALETVGLDPYVGFFHTDRPGRASLALDLMEELRPILVDRFVLRMINRSEVKARDFYKREDGAVIIKKDSRKGLLQLWQTRKNEEIVHPFLEEKVPLGLVPYVQSLLLSRFIRGDYEAYPSFMYKV